MTKKQKKVLIRILLAALMTAVLAFMIPYLTVAYDILLRAGKGIWNRQLLDENFLMAIATVGALVLGAMNGGDYLEAVAVMLFYQTGELFQSYAVGKSRRSIGALMDIRPETAKKYSGAENYFEYASKAILEMHRQVGDVALDENGIIKSGLMAMQTSMTAIHP